MRIVGLGHQAQVGKDTAAAYLVEKHGYTRLAFADILKDMAYDINPIVNVSAAHWRLSKAVDELGWETAKKAGDVRAFLQRLGVAAREHLDEDVWIAPIQRIFLENRDQKFVITDVRFPNEFGRLAQMGAWLIKLTRDAAPSAGTHISETALADADWDVVISNNGTLEDLYAIFDLLIEENQAA